MKKILVLGLIAISLLGLFSVVFAEDTNTAKLTVINTIINDNGGTKTIADFGPYQVGDFNVDINTATDFNAGTYTITENQLTGYVATFSGDCDVNGVVILAAGDNKTCTITNNDQQGTLIVKKIVVNDDNGTLDVNNFSFKVNDGNAIVFETDGQNNLSVNAGVYNILEVAVTGYTTSYNNCSNVTIANSGSATCIITNNDITNDDEDENETDDDNQTDDTNAEINDLNKFGSTQFAMKIKLIHLLNTVQLKTVQAEYVVSYLEDNNSDVNTEPISVQIDNLNAIADRIQAKIDSNSSTKEELLLAFLTEKTNAKDAIKDIRDYIRENFAAQIRNIFKTKFKAEKKDLKPEFQSRVRTLVQEHNTFVKKQYKNTLQQIATEQDGGATKDTITKEFKQKIQEQKTQGKINDGLYVKNNLKNLNALEHANGNNGHGGSKK